MDPFSVGTPLRKTAQNKVALTTQSKSVGGTTGGVINRATLNQKKKSEAIGSIA
jgi:hypothetical protein